MIIITAGQSHRLSSPQTVRRARPCRVFWRYHHASYTYTHYTWIYIIINSALDGLDGERVSSGRITKDTHLLKVYRVIRISVNMCAWVCLCVCVRAVRSRRKGMRFFSRSSRVWQTRNNAARDDKGARKKTSTLRPCCKPTETVFVYVCTYYYSPVC